MTWAPHHDPKQWGVGVEVQSLRAKHSHEAAHDVTVDGLAIRVLPDGHTTARRRYDTILKATTAFEDAAYLVGSLILAGATNIEVDGQPLLEPDGPRGQWRLLFNDDGSMSATFLGGSE